jgi:GNAT superfamily N-acetyltransferase
MKIHALCEAPPPPLARALAEFESRFTYPLGPGRSFRISHGDDYPRFFRSMGNARCFVAERQGRVVGVLAVAVRPLIMPDGATRQAAYVGDLKVDPAVRGSRVYVRLANAADEWARPQVTAAFGVVMDGTRTLPSNYTGRAGIEGFRPVAKLQVLRLSATLSAGDRCSVAPTAEGDDCYRRLSVGRFAASGGKPAQRSETDPLWLIAADGQACGRLEDTCRGKRLFDDHGIEMRSAHLACFAWRDPRAAAEVLHAARRHAARRGFAAVFVGVPEGDMENLEPAITGIDRVTAPATIFAAGLSPGAPWNINTSEI